VHFTLYILQAGLKYSDKHKVTMRCKRATHVYNAAAILLTVLPVEIDGRWAVPCAGDGLR
jgi:hypothetical protein